MVSSPLEDLFARALGLEVPWQLARVTFSEEDRELHLYLDFKRGGNFSCPDCNNSELTAYDTQDKKWRHLDFFQHQAFLHARVPRVKCPSCGVRQVAVPWARSGSGFTLLFEALILTLVQDLPVKALARLIGEHDTRIWRVLRHYIDEARSREDYQDVHRIGIDETARKRGHQYVSLFVDLDRSRVLFTTSGKDQSTVSAFANDFVAHGGDPEAVTDVCCDMSPAFIAGVENDLPEAKITFDRFHVMKIVGDAVDKVRRAEQKDIKELKGSRYLWLRNPETLKTGQQEKLASLTQYNLKTVRAWHIRLNLRDFWNLPPEEAEEHLKRWFFWATHSRLEPIIDAAYTIKRHWDGILRFARSRITNGILEGINSKVQIARNRARGYRSVDYFKTIIYLVAGKLNLSLPT